MDAPVELKPNGTSMVSCHKDDTILNCCYDCKHIKRLKPVKFPNYLFIGRGGPGTAGFAPFYRDRFDTRKILNYSKLFLDFKTGAFRSGLHSS